MKRPSSIDLFSGCGGLTLGLKKAGFGVLAAIENDDLAAETYRMNHPRVHLLKSDIRLVDPVTLRDELGLATGELDLLAGCPPCQGFSSLRTFNGGKVVNEPMNNLVFEFIRFVEAFQPKAIMIENVVGLASDYRITNLCDHLCSLGYSADYKICDAAEFGVPQRRKRMILLAGKSKTIEFGEAIKRKRCVKGTIGKMLTPGQGNDPLHDYVAKHHARTLELIRLVPKNGGSRADLPANLHLDCHRNCDGFRDVYGRMSWSGLAPTITGSCINPSKGRFLHPEEDRAITLREAALLQGFPRLYQFKMDRGRYKAAQMIGNAFPPAFAYRHAIKVRDFLGY